MTDFLKIRIEQGQKLILPRHIIFVEAKNKHSEIYCIDFRRVVSKHPLKWYKFHLEEPYFYRIHDSFIINCHYFEHIRDGKAKLLGETYVPISRNKRQSFETNLEKYYNQVEILPFIPK